MAKGDRRRDVFAFLRGGTGAAQELGRQKVAAGEVRRQEEQQQFANQRLLIQEALGQRQFQEGVRQFGEQQEFQTEQAAESQRRFGIEQEFEEQQFDAKVLATAQQNTGKASTDPRTMREFNTISEAIGRPKRLEVPQIQAQQVLIPKGAESGLFLFQPGKLRGDVLFNVGNLDETDTNQSLLRSASGIKKIGSLQDLEKNVIAAAQTGELSPEDINTWEIALNEANTKFKLARTELPRGFAEADFAARLLNTALSVGVGGVGAARLGAGAVRIGGKVLGRVLGAGRQGGALQAQLNTAMANFRNAMKNLSPKDATKIFKKFPNLKQLPGQARKLLPPARGAGLGALFAGLGGAGLAAAAIPDITQAAQPGSPIEQVQTTIPEASFLPFQRTPNSVIINGSEIQAPTITNPVGTNAVSNIHNNPTPQATASAMRQVETSFRQNPTAWDEAEFNETMKFLGRIRIEQTLESGQSPFE